MERSESQLKANPRSPHHHHCHQLCHHHHHILRCRHPLSLHPHHHHHCNYHHHHHQFPLHPAIHSCFLRHCRHPLVCCPSFIPPQNLQPAASASPPQHNSNLDASGFESIQPSQSTQNLQEEAYQEFEEEADEDPIFVLTDEWREFFAKSEARRREAKKQAKKQGKN
ncbi:hypothetical protein Ancab_022174 [Ancistrocladus abbreviatus]